MQSDPPAPPTRTPPGRPRLDSHSEPRSSPIVADGEAMTGLPYASDVTDALSDVPNDSSHRVTLTYEMATNGQLTLVGHRAADSVLVGLTLWTPNER